MAYVVDAYPEHAASVMTALVLTRAVVGAFLPLVAYPLYDHLGQGLGNTLLAAIAVVLAPIPVLMFHYGEKLRARDPEAWD